MEELAAQLKACQEESKTIQDKLNKETTEHGKVKVDFEKFKAESQTAKIDFDTKLAESKRELEKVKADYEKL